MCTTCPLVLMTLRCSNLADLRERLAIGTSPSDGHVNEDRFGRPSPGVSRRPPGRPRRRRPADRQRDTSRRASNGALAACPAAHGQLRVRVRESRAPLSSRRRRPTPGPGSRAGYAPGRHGPPTAELTVDPDPAGGPPASRSLHARPRRVPRRWPPASARRRGSRRSPPRPRTRPLG